MVSAHFLRVEYTTRVRDLPHSMQDSFNRDVINPQNGHMVCVPYRAICGLSFCLLDRSRTVSRTRSMPRAMLVGFTKTTLLPEFRTGARNRKSLAFVFHAGSLQKACADLWLKA